jgi:hypothetical protein
MYASERCRHSNLLPRLEQVNKPYLPLASGALSSDTALSVVAVCTACSLILGESFLGNKGMSKRFSGMKSLLNVISSKLFFRSVERLECAAVGTGVEASKLCIKVFILV